METVKGRGAVRIAVIGAGAIGRKHALLLQDIGEARLVAICDPSREAAEFAGRSGTLWFADYLEMIGKTAPEAIVVATPTNTHMEIGLACARLGCHLLMEKPLAPDVEDGRRLVDGVDRAGVKLLVGHHRRHNPKVNEIKTLIRSGGLGRLVGVNVLWMLRKPDDYYHVEWRKQPGGGIFLTNLIHEIDNLRFCCGEIAEVFAQASSAVRKFAVEDTGAVSLRFTSGALGTILISDVAPSRHSYEQSSGENSYYFRTDGDCYHFFGTAASLSFPSMRLTEFADRRRAGWQYPLVQRDLETREADPLVAQLQHFCRVVRGLEKPKVGGEDGLQTLKVVHGILESAGTNRPVSFSSR
jgi:predicted dehydrogenase